MPHPSWIGRVRWAAVSAVALIGASLSAPEADVALASEGARDAQRYFGTASGWSYRGSSASASASTLLRARQTSGVLLLFCERGQIGLHLSLSTTDRRSLMGVEDGLLSIYPIDAPFHPPLAQLQIRLFSEHEMRTAPFVQPDWEHPADTLEILRNHFMGLRLVIKRARTDRFISARIAELYLPEGTDGSGLPMDTALTFLERDCQTGLKSHDTNALEQ